MFKGIMKSELSFNMSCAKYLCDNETVTQVCFLLLLEFGCSQNGGVLAKTVCDPMSLDISK